MAKIQFGYDSSENVSFHGVVESDIEDSEWDEMTQEEQTEEMTQALWELVDMYVIRNGEGI